MIFSDPTILIFTLLGALGAGFISGFAGFGTALVASGFWYHVLPAPLVPPLVIFTAVIGQLVGSVSIKTKLNWPKSWRYILAGLIGIPFGTWVLQWVDPYVLKLSIGTFLISYAGFQLTRPARAYLIDLGGGILDRLVGGLGGFLGAFAGLSGAPMIVWCQQRYTGAGNQRAIYQPYNLVILAVSAVALIISGQVSREVFSLLFLCIPATLIGTFVGARLYNGSSDKRVGLAILFLLLMSGCLLLFQTLRA